jgi:hypothetical protein
MTNLRAAFGNFVNAPKHGFSQQTEYAHYSTNLVKLNKVDGQNARRRDQQRYSISEVMNEMDE